MFQEGDLVYLQDTAQLDVGALAWNYVETHREARILDCLMDSKKMNLPESESLYVVVWAEPFEGGWDCWHHCLPGHGQIVTQKNMDLNFEASREVHTVPNIVGYEADADDYCEHL